MTKVNSVRFVALALALLTLAAVFVVCGVVTADAAVVKVGSRGQTVRTIQTKLKRWGYYTGGVDGKFGNGTRAAVIQFQRANGLTADGIVGQGTWEKMF